MVARWETVGKCGVDSEFIMLIDPGYVIPTRAWSKFLKKFKKTEIKGSSEMPGVIIETDHGLTEMGGLGVVIRTPYGGGVYPVEARYDDSGQIVEVRVKFD